MVTVNTRHETGTGDKQTKTRRKQWAEGAEAAV